MYGVEEAQSSLFGYKRSVESPSEESVNESDNNDGGSEDEFVPETVSDSGVGGGSASEEEIVSANLAKNREVFGLDKESNYSMGKRKVGWYDGDVSGLSGGFNFQRSRVSANIRCQPKDSDMSSKVWY